MLPRMSSLICVPFYRAGVGALLSWMFLHIEVRNICLVMELYDALIRNTIVDVQVN